jgi:FAD/FMN-containing dehydrogenase
MKVSSWGKLSNHEHEVISISTENELINKLSKIKGNVIAYGMGRSYGDVCLNPKGKLVNFSHLDKFIDFNYETGVIKCESGVLLKDINNLMVSKGWMLKTSPGTQMVTVGGAIANDVHGKNHHKVGTFGDAIKSLTLLRTSGDLIYCDEINNCDYLKATIGGIGLTGYILNAEIQLKPVSGPLIDVESIPYKSLNEFFKLSDESEEEWEYTVSWLDCLSGKNTRGIFMRGNHSNSKKIHKIQKKPINIPIDLPFSPINNLSLSIFNNIYFHVNKLNSGKSTRHYVPFFYPLDNITNWNRLYGKKGFYQFQCLIPRENRSVAIEEILEEISLSKSGSILSVLKTFGKKDSPGLLSFASPGVTLALDFPNKGSSTLSLLNKLHKIVSRYDGRLYLAKDACMSQEMFKETYKNYDQFLKFRDPGISSQMSKRLFGY